MEELPILLARETLQLLPLLFRQIFQTSKRAVLPQLPPTQLQALMLLEREGKPACMTWLAEELCVSRQQFTKVANALVDKGFVAREPSSENRRMILLTITPEGKMALCGILQDAIDALSGSFSCYTEDELRILRNAGQILRAHIGKDRKDGNE